MYLRDRYNKFYLKNIHIYENISVYKSRTGHYFKDQFF